MVPGTTPVTLQSLSLLIQYERDKNPLKLSCAWQQSQMRKTSNFNTITIPHTGCRLELRLMYESQMNTYSTQHMSNDYLEGEGKEEIIKHPSKKDTQTKVVHFSSHQVLMDQCQQYQWASESRMQ